MLRPILQNPTAAGIGSWLGIATFCSTALSWVAKLNTEWFGVLTWPQSILIGIVSTLAGALVLAIATLIGGIGYRYFRPIPKEHDEAPQAYVEASGSAAPYDDSEIRLQLNQLQVVADRFVLQERREEAKGALKAMESWRQSAMNTDNPLPLGLQHDVNIHGYRMWVDKLGISRDDLNAAIESARNAINNNAEYKIVHANEPYASVDDKRRRHVINAECSAVIGLMKDRGFL